MEIFLSTGLAIVIVKSDVKHDVVELRSAVMKHVQGVLDVRSFERRTAATLEIEDVVDMDTHERRTFGSYLPDEPTSAFTFEELSKARQYVVCPSKCVCESPLGDHAHLGYWFVLPTSRRERPSTFRFDYR
jgi:hypothetical protein